MRKRSMRRRSTAPRSWSIVALALALPLAGCSGGSPNVSQPGVSVLPSAAPGSALLSGLDANDRQKADQARQEALERGAAGTAFTWKSAENSSRYGSVVAGPTYTQSGQNCRQFTQTVYIDGVPQTARSAACRQADGAWRAAS